MHCSGQCWTVAHVNCENTNYLYKFQKRNQNKHCFPFILCKQLKQHTLPTRLSWKQEQKPMDLHTFSWLWFNGWKEGWQTAWCVWRVWCMWGHKAVQGKAKFTVCWVAKPHLKVVFSLIKYITAPRVDLPAAVTRMEPGKRCNVIVAVSHSKSIADVQLNRISLKVYFAVHQLLWIHFNAVILYKI